MLFAANDAFAMPARCLPALMHARVFAYATLEDAAIARCHAQRADAFTLS